MNNELNSYRHGINYSFLSNSFLIVGMACDNVGSLIDFDVASENNWRRAS
jgi:hypothetical protein